MLVGGPAFPVAQDWRYEGLSLRDYFAGQALAGMSGYFVTPTYDKDCGTRRVLEVAVTAYGLADAMLARRKEATDV